MTEMFPYIVTGYLACALVMLACWVYAVRRTNAGVVDLGWAVGLVILAGIYAAFGPGYAPRKLLMFVMALIWGLRISSLLVRRLRKDPAEDSRYQRIRQSWGGNINAKFFVLFQFEAVLDVILSVPFLIICLNPEPRLSFLEIAGFLLCLTAIALEGAADAQLRRFKADPANKGRICRSGLWNYSRHPNYFFEWMVWVSYLVFALASPWGWLALISPVIMFFLLIYVTGIPMIEQHALQTKGEAFRDYMNTTSFFVPWPPRKHEKGGGA